MGDSGAIAGARYFNVSCGPADYLTVHKRRHALALDPVTGQVRNAAGANAATLAGAVCFFAGALLLPERTEEASARIAAPAALGPEQSLATGG